MADWGMKVSRQGYDVQTCADQNLLFSSSFKMPSYIYHNTFNGNGSQQDIYTHSLNYIPACLVFSKQSTNQIQLTSYFGITPTKIFDMGGGISTSFSYFILNIDLEEDYTAPIVNATGSSQGAYNSDWGFKVSKDGVDVKTAELQDLISFSGSSAGGYPVRHQIVQKVGGHANHSTNTTIPINHGLTYAPMFYIYRKYDSGSNRFYRPQMVQYQISGSPPFLITPTIRVWADSTNIYIYQDTTANVDWRFIIFKDPLL